MFKNIIFYINVKFNKEIYPDTKLCFIYSFIIFGVFGKVFQNPNWNI